MPWTPKQTRYLLSSVSPLTGQQRKKMLGEIHGNPAMVHAKKGSPEMSMNPLTGKKRKVAP